MINAYEQGFADCVGKSTDNPYEKGTVRWADWEKGWADAWEFYNSTEDE